MTSKHRRISVVAVTLLAACITIGLSVKWRRNRSNSSLIAELLRIEALPRATRIVEIRKDLWTDTVVEAHLIIPAETVDQLVRGIPLEARNCEPGNRYGVVMTKRWERHFSNADFAVECDETGRHAYVYCAVD